MTFKVFRLLCGFFILGIAILALWGWTAHDLIWASWVKETKPMGKWTAVGLFLSSSPLFLYFKKLEKSDFNNWVGILGLFIVGVGSFSLSEYLLRFLYLPTYPLGGVALPTAVALLFLGIGLNFLNTEMPLSHLLFQKTLRHSLIRIYLAASFIIVGGIGFFSIQFLYHRLLNIASPSTLPFVSSLLFHQIQFTFIAVYIGVIFVVVIGMYLSRKFLKSFESLKRLAVQMERGTMGEGKSFLRKNEWLEVLDLKNAMILVGQRLSEARKNLEEKVGYLEEASQALRESQKVTISLLEDMDETNRQLAQAKEELQKLNLTLEAKVDERTRELRSAQEKLVRQEKLAALGQLASAVAHEIRNPLTGLANSTYYLKLCEAEIGDKEIKKHLVLINKQVGLIDQLVTNLLDFGRVKEPEKKPTDISALLHEVLEKFPSPSNVRVVLQPPSKGLSVEIDPLQIGQVFGNLITNAYQAMLKGGSLTIQTKQNQPNEWTILFADTGSGISPENLSKIFEPLFSTKPQGTGLGLAICKQLVEKHGGSLEVESLLGKGSKFIVKLPSQIPGT